jgi:flagellar M-ring protein FliF
VQNLMTIWAGLSPKRRAILAASVVGIFLAILGLSRMATQPSMGLLYAGLEGPAAGDMVAALEARGVGYEVRGTSIFVDASARDQLRLTLAGEGLPSNGTQGYELLDTLSGFGTTSQMFDAAYWRAKEGELARTIVTSPAIQSARVHIAAQGGRPFQRELRPTASVTISTLSGGLGAAHARALRFLVASAVAGLSPEDVAVIDARGGTILAAEGAEAAPDASNARAAELKQSVERLLEARVGAGRAVVEVSVETVQETEQITERRVDPDSRVAISQETESRSTSAADQGGTAVTVASNLPDGDAAANQGSSQSEDSESREIVNYEVSELQREVTRGPGAIRRISVAVLVDGIRGTGDDGSPSWQPRDAEEMEALFALVASAVGYDEARGDSLTLRSMEFEPVLEAGSPPASAFLPPLSLDPMRLIQMGLLALVTLLLGLFVIRPILAKPPAPQGLPAPLLTEGAGAAAATGLREAPLTGEIDEGAMAPAGLQLVPADAFPEDAAPGPDPVERLRSLIDQRRGESVAILKSWIEDEETA